MLCGTSHVQVNTLTHTNTCLIKRQNCQKGPHSFSILTHLFIDYCRMSESNPLPHKQKHKRWSQNDNKHNFHISIFMIIIICSKSKCLLCFSTAKKWNSLPLSLHVMCSIARLPALVNVVVWNNKPINNKATTNPCMRPKHQSTHRFLLLLLLLSINSSAAVFLPLLFMFWTWFNMEIISLISSYVDILVLLDRLLHLYSCCFQIDSHRNVKISDL